MTPARWLLAQEALTGALERPPAERTAYLQDVCAGDPDLLAEVQSLLEALERTGPADRLDALASSMMAHLEFPMPYERIGPYRILREIGGGGMGTVYLAERDDEQFTRRVALKVVRGGADNPEIVRRFLVERQILSELHHPNIASLLDGGVTPDGRPYFVMEYVEGTSIDAYCDGHRLSIEERLHLFQSVCEAVHSAHQNLIVHRDLKPANILVAEDGAVKLLDFGIAKLLADEPTASVMLTRTGARWMTPEYAAPEQIRGERITTATDVYALGLLLYELLAGRLPYDVKEASGFEIEQAICNTEPVRPSVAATRKATIEEVSRARRTNPDRLRRRLSGDLDMIALKALRKEPERRYASAERFLEDIKRHLAGLPVEARPDTLSYRAAKFVRRHRLGVVAAALVAVSLVAGMAGTTWQAQIAARERDQAEREMMNAERARRQAEEVSEFLMSLFEASDPGMARGDTLTALQLLQRGVGRAEELAGQPAVQARMLDVIGQVYRRLGQFEASQHMLEQAVAQWRGLDDPGELARSLNHLGLLFMDRGDFTRAEMLLREAYALRRELHSGVHPDWAESLHNLAGLYYEQGDYPAAESLFNAAFLLRQHLFGEDHPLTVRTMRFLAGSLNKMGKYGEAEPVQRKLLEIQRSRYGTAHPEIATALNDLALTLSGKGDLEAAGAFHRESIAVRRALYGDRHPRVAVALVNYAKLVMDRDLHEDAVPLLTEALSIFRDAHGPEHSDVAWAAGTLAAAYSSMDEHERALPLHRDALMIHRQTLGAHHPRLATTMLAYANTLVNTHRYGEAEPIYREALAIYREAYGAKHPDVATAHRNLGRLYQAQGRFDLAERHLRTSLATYRETLPPGHARTASALLAYGEMLTAKGELTRAEPLLREALRTYEAEAGGDRRQTAHTQVALGHVLMLQGRHADAEALLVQGYESLRERGEPRSGAASLLVQLYERMGREDKATGYRAAVAGAAP